MFKKIFVIACVAFFFSRPAFSADHKLKVITTLFPQYDFARIVGSEEVSVRLLLPPGVESHSFEPTPRQIAEINQADVFIYTNEYMEPWVQDILKGVTNRNLLVVDASKGIKFMADEDEGGVDPHVWLDLGNAQIMVDNIRDGLSAKDPVDSMLYTLNAEKYNQQLQQLDKKFARTIKKCRKKTFIFGGHFAFGYFAKRYGLKYMSAYKGFSPDAEPTVNDLIEMIRKMRMNNIKYIYYEELISPKVAQTIAVETSAGLLLLHGAHNVSKQELASGATFISIMEHDLENLKVGLEWQGQ